jgi:hypothetical protein
MNEHDKANLEFMLSASKETLADWFITLSEDDIAYAEELLYAARAELDLRIVELHDDVPDVTLANSVLDKYRLK